MQAVPVAAGIVLTVGHSSRELEAFRRLLSCHSVDVLVDVRSVPYSALHPQFNQPVLRRAFARSGVRYFAAGKVLGGRPADTAYYDDEGKVLYWKLAQSPAFQRGIDRLLALASDGHRVAVMCAEEDPAACHRRLLVGRAIMLRGGRLAHIRADGELEEEQRPASAQHTLFGGVEEPAWTSIRSVSPRRAQPSSSMH